MVLRSRIFSIDDVLWQADLPLLRSWDGRVPWDERFGRGRIKVLEFNPTTQAGTYLFHWPSDYDPLGEHGHGSNATELILAGSLIQAEQVLGPATFLYLAVGERHGPFRAGPDGCTFLLHTDGPLFDPAFIQALMDHGKTTRFRVDLADRPV
jgi:hypothetical protein